MQVDVNAYSSARIRIIVFEKDTVYEYKVSAVFSLL